MEESIPLWILYTTRAKGHDMGAPQHTPHDSLRSIKNVGKKPHACMVD